MALYENGILISGANTLPQMTLAEYQALPVSERPTYWERTDLNYSNIPASDVTYGSGSVEDALDSLTASQIKKLAFTETSDASYGMITVDMGSSSKKLVSIVINAPSGYWVRQYSQDGQNAYAVVADWQGTIRTSKTVYGYVYYMD